MIERRLQVIQELRETYKELLADLTEANNSGDIHCAALTARKLDFAYKAFQRAVEAYEKNRLVNRNRLRSGGTGDGFKGR